MLTPPTPPNRMQFRAGILAMKDGSNLQDYLTNALEEGDVVLVNRDFLQKLYTQAFYYRTQAMMLDDRFIIAA